MKQDLVFHLYMVAIILAVAMIIGALIVGKFVGNAIEEVEYREGFSKHMPDKHHKSHYA